MKRAPRHSWKGALAAAGLALCGAAAPRAQAAEILISDVQVVLGSDRDGRSPRAPALVRRGAELSLFYRTSTGERKRGWTRAVASAAPGLEASSSAGQGETSKPWIDWIPDQLDLTKLPGEEFQVASTRWRNGRLLNNGVPVGWCPEWTRASDGSSHLIFDRHDRGDYDVIYAGPEGWEQRVAGTKQFEANASLAVGENNRVYCAWDQAEAGFGRGGALHRERQIRFGVLTGDEFRDLPLPRGMLEGALGRGSEGFSMAELPRLVVDEAGVLWFFFRAMARWNRVENNGKRGTPDTGSNRRVVWEWRVAARSSETEGWSAVKTLPQSDGPGVDGLALVSLPNSGLAVVYESDGRMREFPRAGAWENSLSAESRLVAVELSIPGGALSWESAEARELGRTDSESPNLDFDPAPDLVPEGYQRMWGDLHRHSDLSRCKMDEDGNQLAQYRYALDIAKLDFLAMTEHYQHLSPGQWDYSLEMSERFNRKGSFASLFGFEQAQPDGHRNLFCMDVEEARDAPFRKWTPSKRFVPYPAAEWIAIPHQLADPKVLLEWPRNRGAVERAVEIYQSRRGSYFSEDDYLRAFHAVRTHPHAIDYLKQGSQFGVVAASDHVTTSSAYTAVYVREKSRKGLFEGLRARRVYAATAKIALDVQLDSLLMGQSGPVEESAPLKLRVHSAQPLARVEILRNGEVVKAYAGKGDERLLTVRLGGSTQDPRLALRLEGAEWSGEPMPFRATRPETIVVTEAGVLIDGELGDTGECGLIARVILGSKPILHLERERVAESVALVDESGQPVSAPIESRIGSVRAEVRLDPAPLGSVGLSHSWSPRDWKPGDWVQVRVIRMDGEMAWSTPIWITGQDE